MPTKTIIAALREHQPPVDRQDNTDLDYLGTRYNLHYLKQIAQRAISPGNRATDLKCAGINRTAEAELIAYAGPDDL